MARYILGIDQSTRGTKAVIFDHDAGIVSSAYREITQYYPQPGWVEHDPEEIWKSTLKVIGETLKNGRVAPEEIEAIGISNQIGTTIFWNKETGEPIGRAIVWQDRRTQPICERLGETDQAGVQARTGLVIVPNWAGTKIRWLMENDKSVQKGIARSEILFGTIDSWLIWKLSGGAIHVTDLSNAACTLLLNARTLTYDEWMLNELAIPRDILPNLCSSSEIYAHTDPDMFLGVRIPIGGVATDQSAALFGQVCFKAGMAKTTFGTGSSLTLNIGNKYIAPESGLIAPVHWAIGGNVTYGLAGWHNVSGGVIEWLKGGLGIIRKDREADGLAAQVPDTQGVYFVPAFMGLDAPYSDSYARGMIIGITSETKKHHIARAALEAIIYQIRDSYELMKQKLDLEIAVVRADGGGAQSDFLLQFEADMLGIPVERPAMTETTVLGAAYLAGLAVGYWQSLEEIASKWRVERRFDPSISVDRRDYLYHGWQKAIRHATGWLKE
ncbi:MAG: glycerol kinase [Chloroflexi bacterium]|nr:glycerol kinase [Chloroflexota bacterium]